jgi:hypothetical protein
MWSPPALVLPCRIATQRAGARGESGSSKSISFMKSAAIAAHFSSDSSPSSGFSDSEQCHTF